MSFCWVSWVKGGRMLRRPWPRIPSQKQSLSLSLSLLAVSATLAPPRPGRTPCLDGRCWQTVTGVCAGFGSRTRTRQARLHDNRSTRVKSCRSLKEANIDTMSNLNSNQHLHAAHLHALCHMLVRLAATLPTDVLPTSPSGQWLLCRSSGQLPESSAVCC